MKKVYKLFSIYLLITGDLADLIFVFFDPMGQALCKRTLNIVGMFTVNGNSVVVQ